MTFDIDEVGGVMSMIGIIMLPFTALQGVLGYVDQYLPSQIWASINLILIGPLMILTARVLLIMLWQVVRVYWRALKGTFTTNNL
jgi:Mg2+ and Co2+ transporter CorA